ncbi:MAG: flagellar biosynthesis protein FlhA [Bryobacteraceae bacterium]|nr:flagellar biosynthesis protein FlhA [Bryobacteraceae bacterium]
MNLAETNSMAVKTSGWNWTEMLVPVGVLAIILAMITPLPAILLDLLIVIDIMLSVVVLMVAMYLNKPTDFTVFPTTLLLLTLFRLALNISSSRLILLNGSTGTTAAGHVIEAFGNFVVGGNYIVGVVIFLVLIAIQYVVINHGAVRISEVTARFTLDALPGKQMSIDADLNAGLIDEIEARKRRKELGAEAEFYGAMDGASRFTQRDALAAILITVINIVAGFLIGVFQHGMELQKAIQTYTVLTIGDGLVTVIPALMISVAGAVIVTRASSEQRLGADFQKQIFGQPEPLFLASGVLVVLAAFPGLPAIPFLALAGGLGTMAWRLKKAKDKPEVDATDALPATPAKENLEALMKVDAMSIEVGGGLIGLVTGGATSPLIQKISAIRRHFAGNSGFLLPPVRVTDNMMLKPREYVLLIKGGEAGRFELKQGCELAITTPRSSGMDGIATSDPAFGVPALWITADRAEAARMAGYTVVDSLNVLGTHLSELVKSSAHEIFSRQDAKAFCDRVGQEAPKAVEELTPKLLSLAAVQRVLQNLLREQVSIRDGLSIMEALGEVAATTRNPVLLTEYVRQALRRTLVKPLLSATGDLKAWFLDPNLEHSIEKTIEHSELNSVATLAPQTARDLITKVTRNIDSPHTPAVLIVSAGARYFVRQYLENSLPNLHILSHNEIPGGLKVQSLGLIQ